MDMDRIKLAAEVSSDFSRDVVDNQGGAGGRDAQIRTLRDLELMLAAGGGDGVPTW
jgi:hypothetical protein